MSFDRRAAVDRIIEHYLPSKYGDERFDEIINGHWQPGAGTTCAYLPALILTLLGARDERLVNRDDPEGQGRTRFNFGNTTNGISKLYFGGKSAGVFVDDGPGREPQRGDIVYMSAGTPATEHVEVFQEIRGNTWVAAAAGQGTREAQEAKIVERTITDERDRGGARYVSSAQGERKKIMGWVDIDLVELVEPPMGVAAEPETTFGERARKVAVPIVGTLGVVALGGLIWLALQPAPDFLDAKMRRARARRPAPVW